MALTLGLSAPGFAADTAVPVNAIVVRPLSLVKADDLEFGTLISGTTSGTVVINAATNARTSTGGVTLVGTGHRAIFLGAATSGRIVLISGSNSTTLARSGGLAAPLMVNLTRSTGAGVTPLFGGLALVGAGLHTYYVGGTLNVPPNQMAGDYSGTFTLTVNYF